MPLAFAELLLICATTCIERLYRLHHYSQIVVAYITLQTIFSLTVLNYWIGKGLQRRCSLPGGK